MKEHGLTLYASGRLQEAYQAFLQAIQQNPADAESRMMVGVISARTGNLANAITCFREAIRLQPAYGAAWSNLGLAQLNAGSIQEAEGSLRRAVELEPGDVSSLNNLAALYRQLGRVDAALKLYERALQLNPRDINILNNLGGLYQGLCRNEEAIAVYRKALRLAPGFAQCEFNLGSVLQAEGQHQQAVYHYQKALQLDPSLTDATAAIARLQEKEGKFEAAAETLSDSLKSDFPETSILAAYAILAKRTGESDRAIEHLQRALSRPAMPPIDRQQIEYLLGDLFDRNGDYEAAFHHYQQANEIRKYACDRSVYDEYLRLIMRRFPPGSFGDDGSHADYPPVILIVGMPRSGTSLVEQILASHPQVHGAGELPYVGNLVMQYSREKKTPSQTLLDHMSAADIRAFGKKYLKQVRAIAPGSRFVTDKMPHNFLHLGLLAQALPNVRIVHCLRNPVDTCLSIYFHDFNANHPYSTDLAELGYYYRHYQALMAYWRMVLGDQLLDMTYEDILEDQEGKTRALLEFCGLPWDEGCMSFHENKRIVNTPSYDQVRRPIYKTSSERWRNYERHLSPLLNALGAEL
jgi:tetratricopeptide (TPR) repeat protein